MPEYTLRARFDGSEVKKGLDDVRKRARESARGLDGFTSRGKEINKSIGDIRGAIAGWGAPILAAVGGLRLISSELKTASRVAGEFLTTIGNQSVRRNIAGIGDEFARMRADAIATASERQQALNISREGVLFDLSPGDDGDGNQGALTGFLRRRVLAPLGLGHSQDLSTRDREDARVQQELAADLARIDNLERQARRDGVFSDVGNFARSVQGFADDRSPEQRIQDRLSELRGTAARLSGQNAELGLPYGDAIDRLFGEAEAGAQRQLETLRKAEEERLAPLRERYELEAQMLEIDALRAQGLERQADLAQIELEKRRAIAAATSDAAAIGADPADRIARIERLAQLRAAGLDVGDEPRGTATSVSSGSVGFGGSALIARSLGGGQPEQRTASATERTASVAEQIAATLQTMRLSSPPGGGGAVFAS